MTYISFTNHSAQPDLPPSPAVHQDEDTFRPFPIEVTRVDPDTPSISVKNRYSQEIFDGVTQFPVTGSSYESTDMGPPEVGATGLALALFAHAGTMKVAVICWTPGSLDSNRTAVAHRPMQDTPGMSTRYRGAHRKAYPGQRSATKALGLHEHEGSGWERLTADFSQDKVDADRRQWLQVTGRKVDYTEGGLRFSGPVNRPGADAKLVPTERLPDGSLRQVVYLQDSKKVSDRYLKGQRDMLPLSEVLERVQEFGLDFPVPYEALESGMLDDALGIKADLWARTTTTTQKGIQRDDQSFLTDMGSDHPHDATKKACGPTTKEGATPRRRGYIIERSMGTLVGYNKWDSTTYGKVLKPVLWPTTRDGRFSTETDTGHLPVKASTDHVETRLAASAFHMRFPHEYNTTRVDITKEGMILLEVGSTIPKENIPLDGGTYEHPWGAGRSLEAHLVGSAKLVMGKNRDEEESLDLVTTGQVVMRLGADDGALPDAGRKMTHQTRGKGDAVLPRDLQYWSKPKLAPGDAGDPTNKTGAENISLRAATDGGVLLRLGARHEKSRRRHMQNGYDAQGSTQQAPGTGGRSSSPNRPFYSAGDSTYKFGDLRTAGKSTVGMAPYFWSGDPVINPDVHGLSLDVHAVRDVFLRVGKNKLSDQSLLLDLEGGIVALVGKDKKSRSLTASLMGGIELSIGANSDGRGLQLEVLGDCNLMVKGNYHVFATGDIVFDAMGNIFSLSKKEHITKGMNVRSAALVQHVQEALDVVNQQGGHTPTGA